MKCGTQIALAVGAGYFLGRKHRMRLALLLGAAAASGRLASAPGELLQRGTKALGSAPGADQVGDVGGRLVEAGRAAAMAAAASRIEALTARLHEQAETLRTPPSPDGGAEDKAEPEDEAEPEDKAKPEEEPEEEEEFEEEEPYDEEESYDEEEEPYEEEEEEEEEEEPRGRRSAEEPEDEPEEEPEEEPRRPVRAGGSRRAAPVRRARR